MSWLAEHPGARTPRPTGCSRAWARSWSATPPSAATTRTGYGPRRRLRRCLPGSGVRAHPLAAGGPAGGRDVRRRPPRGVARAEDAAGDTYVNVLGADLTQCIEQSCSTRSWSSSLRFCSATACCCSGVPAGLIRLTPMLGETAHWYSVVLIRFNAHGRALEHGDLAGGVRGERLASPAAPALADARAGHLRHQVGSRTARRSDTGAECCTSRPSTAIQWCDDATCPIGSSSVSTPTWSPSRRNTRPVSPAGTAAATARPPRSRTHRLAPGELPRWRTPRPAQPASSRS